MFNKIHYSKPTITKHEIDMIMDAAKYGWGDKCYDYINKFEEIFKDFIGVKYAIATSSCTGAMHMGLYALNISKGDEVILADTNWIATVSPIVHLGAKPIFVDIDPLTWCIDPKEVEKKINKNTKAIIATHLYGNLCEMSELLEISKKYKIPLIEDSAEAIGSEYQTSKAGSMGLFSTFSFHGSKTITTGEGGMFLTNNKKLYEDVVTLNNHGRDKKQKKQFWSDVIGFKYRMTNIDASLGYAQMLRIDKIINRKRYILNYYKSKLLKYEDISMNFDKKNNTSGAWMPTVVFSKKIKIKRKTILNAFKEKNIDARVFFWPLSTFPMFKSQQNNFNSWSIAERAINLPSYHDIKRKELDVVIKVIKTLIEKNLK